MAFYKRYQLQQGDTLQSVAQKELGDLSLWENLVESNNLKYPFIVSTPGGRLADPEHLVTYGDFIKLPIPKTTLSELEPDDFNTYQRQLIYDLSLGMDISASFDSDTVSLYNKMYLTEPHRGTDLVSISGINNLKQSIQLRLLTPQGTLLLHPEYGTRLLNYLGEKISLDILDMVQDEVVRTIFTDDRVEDVSIKSVNYENGLISIVVEVTPINEAEAFNLFISKLDNGELKVN